MVNTPSHDGQERRSPHPHIGRRYQFHTFRELSAAWPDYLRGERDAVDPFWDEIDEVAFPVKDLPLEGDGAGRGDGGGRNAGPDQERVDFIRSFEKDGDRGALFGFSFRGKNSFDRYICIVFPDYIYLDCPYKKNRAFVRGIPPLHQAFEELGVDLSKPPGQRVGSEGRARIIRMLKVGGCLPIDTSKSAYARLEDVVPVEHVGKWQERVCAGMDKLGAIGEQARTDIEDTLREEEAA